MYLYIKYVVERRFCSLKLIDILVVKSDYFVNVELIFKYVFKLL